MDRPSTSHSRRGPSRGANEHRRARASTPWPGGRSPRAPLGSTELRALRRWLVAGTALRPRQASDLLERALTHRQLVDEPALHWKAVKASVAGDANWVEMGFRLAFD